jgi:hypothetical protein
VRQGCKGGWLRVYTGFLVEDGRCLERDGRRLRGIQKQKARAAGQDIFHRASIFITCSIANHGLCQAGGQCTPGGALIEAKAAPALWLAPNKGKVDVTEGPFLASNDFSKHFSNTSSAMAR